MYMEQKIELLEETVTELKEEIRALKARAVEQVLTPEEFSKLTKINKNTVYCWIKEGRIQILPNLGTAKRIPMSQFYEKQESEELTNKENKADRKVDYLKREFMAMYK